jgi:soluble lytic murein transglycosylase-like protein
MRACFISGRCRLIWLALAAAFTAVAGDVPATPHKISTVRVDPASGRLIRSFVVSPRVIAPRIAAPAVPARDLEVPPGASISDLVDAAAKQYNVDPLLVHSLIQVESGYNPKAVSPKGAQGLMQLMPATAKGLGVGNSFDPRQNIEAGVRHLRQLTEQYRGDLRLALAAYNAGAGAVARYNTIPPYPETLNYVYQVGKRYGDARRAAVRAKPASPALTKSAEVIKPPKIVQYEDSEGRLHLRAQ